MYTPQAKVLLQRRTYRQGLLDKTDQQILNLEEMVCAERASLCVLLACLTSTAANALQVNTIEFTLVEQQVMEGLKSGNDTLKEIQQQMTVEDAEKIMADTQEAKEYLVKKDGA